MLTIGSLGTVYMYKINVLCCYLEIKGPDLTRLQRGDKAS